MKISAPSFLRRCLVLFAAQTLGCALAADVQFEAASFVAASTTDPAHPDRIRTTGNLAGKAKPDDWFGGGGWVEYAFDVPETGWHELISIPSCGEHEFIFDNTVRLYGGEGQDVSGQGQASEGKAGNVFLTAGPHRLRVQRWAWTGFGAIRRLELRRTGSESPAKTVRVSLPQEQRVVRAGNSLNLNLATGARTQPGSLEIQVSSRLPDGAWTTPTNVTRVSLPSSRQPTHFLVSVPCPSPGIHRLSFASDATPIPAHEIGLHTFVVVATNAVPRGGPPPARQLVQAIDCVRTPPDYFGGGDTRVVESAFGPYRESGDHGYLAWQHLNSRNISFFAYRFSVPETHKPYVLEVDYPDDQARTMIFAIREGVSEAYPIAAGPDTGGEFPLSNQMQTYSLLFWPRSTDLRLVVMPPGDRPAAAARIRVYQLQDELRPLDVPARGGRHFVNWYEEGNNYLSVFGAPNRGLDGMITGADRWARTMASQGADTLWPTVSVYQMAMYPSAYNTDFVDPGTFDHVRLLLLTCERYQMRFVGEFHPEGRDLLRNSMAADASLGKPVRTNALFSKNGDFYAPGSDNPGFPKHHPLHPQCQDWYVGMIGEFADRYRDSPAFEGISLRLMEWHNPGLNNFHSLDWGYDDFTVGLFERETGLKVDGEGAKRFEQRHAWLMEHARDRWIQWRCEKIAQLLTRIRDRVRQARPDLKVFLPGFTSENRPGMGREAGIDPVLLNALEGVVLVNGSHVYGRRKAPLDNQRLRDELTSPSALRAFCGDQPGHFVFGAGYFEANDSVIPPADLGYPNTVKHGWVSGVATPSGDAAVERYAVALAETGALTLGDGGNAYTVGQPPVAQWMRQYRSLPDVAFARHPDASDPVAVWETTLTNNPVFFAVNREGYPVEVTLHFAPAPPRCSNLAESGSLPVQNGELRVSVPPFGLRTFRAPAPARISRVVTTPPPEAIRRAQLQSAWVRRLLDQSTNSLLRLNDSNDRALLAATAAEVSQACQEGHLWRVHTLLERTDFIQRVCQKTALYPPFSGAFHADLAYERCDWPLRDAVRDHFGQKDTARAETLTQRLHAEQGSARLEWKPMIASRSVVTWSGAVARLELPFEVKTPQVFRVWLEADRAGGTLSVVSPGGSETAVEPVLAGDDGLTTLFSGSATLALRPGDRELRIRQDPSRPTALSQVFLETLFTSLDRQHVAFLGYFPNPTNAQWELQLPPEKKDALSSAAFPGTDGLKDTPAKWSAPSQELWDGQASAADAPHAPGLIGYAAVRIQSPDARTAWLAFTPHRHMRIFLNHALVEDTLQSKRSLGWYQQRPLIPLALQAGENLLLFKLSNGQEAKDFGSMRLEAQISNPGDVTLAEPHPGTTPTPSKATPPRDP